MSDYLKVALAVLWLAMLSAAILLLPYALRFTVVPCHGQLSEKRLD